MAEEKLMSPEQPAAAPYCVADLLVASWRRLHYPP